MLQKLSHSFMCDHRCVTWSITYLPALHCHLPVGNVRGSTDWNHSPPPGTRVTVFMSYLTRKGPGKEHGTNKTPSTGRVQERSKGYTTCPTNLPESSWLESILAEQCVHHQERPWVRKMDQRQPGNWPCHHKTMWLNSSPGFPYPHALCPGVLCQYSLLLCQQQCLIGQFISKCQTRAHSQALKVGPPLPATESGP